MSISFVIFHDKLYLQRFYISFHIQKLPLVLYFLDSKIVFPCPWSLISCGVQFFCAPTPLGVGWGLHQYCSSPHWGLHQLKGSKGKAITSNLFPDPRKLPPTLGNPCSLPIVPTYMHYFTPTNQNRVFSRQNPISQSEARKTTADSDGRWRRQMTSSMVFGGLIW